MRHLLLFVPLLALMLFHSTEAAPPTLSVDSGQDVAQVAPAVPTSVDAVTVDNVADVQPTSFVDSPSVTTIDGACATGVLLRDFLSTSLTASTTTYSNNRQPLDVMISYRENKPDGTTRLRC